MTAVNSIIANKRLGSGTGVARACRREGLVPGIIYGEGADPEMISVDAKALRKELSHSGIFSKIYSLKVDKSKAQLVVVRDVQLHPVSDEPVHIDFMRVSRDHKITVKVPLLFVNEEQSPALKHGGVLNVVAHDIEIECMVDSVPDHLEIDLSGADFHKSFHCSEISLPKGASMVSHGRGDYVVATVVAPSSVRSEAQQGSEEESGKAE